MSRYLVTGAAGFIAARVAEMLLESGHQVVGVDNLNDAYDVRMKEYRLRRLLGREGFSFHRLDISDRGLLEAGSPLVGQDFAAVINLAARAGVRQAALDPWVYVETNTTGTLNLLELCRRQGIPKLILASTSSIYGANAPLPTPEAAGSSLPLQAYAASKKGAEAMCHAYHHLYGVDITVFRYFTVYGPAGRPDMSMFRFTKWIYEGQPLLLTGDGQQSRGFTYVDDIARGTILGLRPLGYEIINLGGHETIKMVDLIHMLEERIGKTAQIERLPFPAADMWANQANVEKAGRLLGWEPAVNLAQGVSRLVDWYEAERAWASQVSTE
jgi:nucleoside-diphosphate-sugar epimerase